VGALRRPSPSLLVRLKLAPGLGTTFAIFANVLISYNLPV
jgi:hypothetical protein